MLTDLMNEMDCKILLVIGIDKENNQIITNVGLTDSDKLLSNELCDKIRNFLESLDVKRICNNCQFFDINTKDPKNGKCFVDPFKCNQTIPDRNGCRFFEPKVIIKGDK